MEEDHAQVWDEFSVEINDEIDNFLNSDKPMARALMEGLTSKQTTELTLEVEKEMFSYRDLVFPEYKAKAEERATV